MLDSLRKGASGIIAKGLMLFLVLTFAVWGIGDILRNSGGSTLAKVGDVSIGVMEFESRLRQMQRSMGGELPAELSNSPQFRNQALQGMIQQALLLQEAQREGLALDTKAVARLIAESGRFSDENGKFDRAAYDAFLRSNDMSEAMFIETLRRDAVTGMLLQSLSLPKTLTFPNLARALAMAQAQSRNAELYVIPAIAPSSIPAPDEKTLESYYTEVKDDYLTPERRTIDYVVIPHAAVEAHLRDSIDDQDIEERYASSKAQYGEPEKRDVTQWLFENESDAKAAADALKQGSRPANGKATPMKSIVRTGLPKEAADPVFALKEKDISNPIKTGFGWHVFVVDRIQEPKVPELAAVKARIIDLLVTERAEDELLTLSGQLEDSIAAGDSIAKAADTLKIGAKTGTLDNVDREGKRANGAVPADTITASALARGFGMEEGENSSFERAPTKDYIAVFVREVTSQAPRSLAEIKPQLLKRYAEEQAQQQSAKKAQDAVAKLAEGKSEGISHRSVSGITLAQAMNASKETNGMPVLVMRSLFDAELGETTPPARLANGDWVIAKVTQINQSLNEPASDITLPEKDREQLANATYNDYLAYLVKRYEVVVNPKLLKSDNNNE